MESETIKLEDVLLSAGYQLETFLRENNNCLLDRYVDKMERTEKWFLNRYETLKDTSFSSDFRDKASSIWNRYNPKDPYIEL